MSFPINSTVIFHCYVNVYQRATSTQLSKVSELPLAPLLAVSQADPCWNFDPTALPLADWIALQREAERWERHNFRGDSLRVGPGTRPFVRAKYIWNH